MKETLQGIGRTAFDRVRRKPDTVERVVSFLSYGNDERIARIADSQILGPYVPGAQPELVRSNPPLLHIGGNETVSLDIIAIRRRGFLGWKASITALAYPVDRPESEGTVAVRESVYDREAQKRLTHDVEVFLGVANCMSPERNLQEIALDVRFQVNEAIEPEKVKRYAVIPSGDPQLSPPVREIGPAKQHTQ